MLTVGLHDTVNGDSQSISLGQPAAVVSVTDASPETSSDARNACLNESLIYLHFVEFLALRNIPVIPRSDVCVNQSATGTLGVGGFNRVLTGTWNGQYVAIKASKRRSESFTQANGQKGTVPSTSWLRSLYFEMQVMSHQPLCNHPNISRLVGLTFFEDEDFALRPVLLMEPAAPDHPDLLQYIGKQGASVDLEMLSLLIIDIASGLATLHVYGILHGDLKPENILIYKDSDRFTAKICDFGLSGYSPSDEPPIGISFLWAAPEIRARVSAGDWDLPSYQQHHDIYSYGLICTFVLLRQDPSSLFKNDDGVPTEQVIEQVKELANRTSREEKLSARLLQRLDIISGTLGSCLCIDPGARLKSLEDMKNLLYG